MSRYVVRELEEALDRPSRRELLAAIRSQPEAVLRPSPGEILRGGTGMALMVQDASSTA